MMRSIAAVVTGFVLIGALAFGADALMRDLLPHAYDGDGRLTSLPLLLFSQLYVAVFAIGGCYLAARLAPSRPLLHAMILGVLGLVFNIAGSIAAWDTLPVWYHLTAIALVLPYAWIGGRIRQAELEHGQLVAGVPA